MSANEGTMKKKLQLSKLSKPVDFDINKVGNVAISLQDTPVSSVKQEVPAQVVPNVHKKLQLKPKQHANQVHQNEHTQEQKETTKEAIIESSEVIENKKDAKLNKEENITVQQQSKQASILQFFKKKEEKTEKKGQEQEEEEQKAVDPLTVGLENKKQNEGSSQVKVSFELISYFLDKDIEFVIEEDDRIPFNKRLNFFLNRKYENQNKPDMSRQNNKPSNRNGGQYNQRSYNQQGNTRSGETNVIARGDGKKLTSNIIPQVHDQHGSNSGVIRRGEEDQEVTKLKMQIKAQSALFLEKMRSEKLDSLKKQISDIRMDLNILTPTNFNIIKVKLLDLALSDDVLCEYVVEGIIEKARTQKTYSVVYGNLCKYMIDESKIRYPTKQGEEENPKQKIFKNHLYSNIQSTFEGEKDIYNNKMSFVKSKKLEDITSEEERTQYYDDKKKRDMLNVKFIGNLFLNKSMNLAIMRMCCGQLLSRFVEGYCKYEQKSDQVEEALYENDLDALVALFEQTGQKMQERHDADKNKTDNSKLVSEFINDIERKEHQPDIFENLNFDDYFTVFEWLQKNKKVSPRLYSLIVNLIERKNDNWKERLSTQKGPVSLENLHKQHEQDIKQSQQELAKYEQDQKSGKGRGYKKNNNQRQQSYVAVTSQQQEKPKVTAKPNGKYDEKSGIVRAKEFWGYLDLKIKLQEDYTVENAVKDFKQLREQCDPLVFGEILLKTVYDCNVIHKANRILVACEATSFLKPNEFLQAFSERLNKSKDETSDFPLFLDFLSQLFLHVYRQGEIKFSGLQVAFKKEYDESDQEDVLFVYKNFIEECIQILKVEQPTFDVAKFLNEQIESVLAVHQPDDYASFVKNMTR